MSPKKIDSYLLRKCESFTHWLQIKYDRDNFWVARKLFKWLLPLTFGAFGTILVIKHLVSITELLALLFAGFVLHVLFIHLIFPEISRFKQETYADVAKGSRNRREIHHYQSTAYFTTFFSLALVATFLFVGSLAIAHTLMMLCSLTALYFLDVTPLNPNEVEKVRMLKSG